jgi:hypothetical protein
MTSNLGGYKRANLLGAMGRDADQLPEHVVYRDKMGAVVTDPAQAANGEILGDPDEGTPRRAWFRIEEIELDWLPVRESAFLLWVLALVAAVWLAIGVVLHFT